MKKRRKTNMAESFSWGQGGNMREESFKMAVKGKKRKKAIRNGGKMKTEYNGVRGIRSRSDCHRIKNRKDEDQNWRKKQ